MTHFTRVVGTIALTLAASFVCTAALGAQSSTTRGFNFGFHLQGASLTVEDGDRDQGGGAGLRVGYGFNRIVTGYVEFDGVSVDVANPDLSGTWNLAHADLGARFHFANALRRVVPFLEVAVGARAVSVKDAQVNATEVADVTFSGGAFSLGGGLMAYFKESLALDVSLKGSFGQFNKIDVGAVSVGGLDIDATSSRFKVGIVWWR